MAGAKSKNSRTIATSTSKNLIVGDVRLVVPCNAGKNAYITNVTSATSPHLPTDSEAFAAVVRANTEAGLGAKQRAEFELLAATYPDHAWPAVLARLEKVGAFDLSED